LTGTPSEKILLNEYIKKERQVPWKIYQKQPDNVYFSHAAHQEYKCIQCHPDIGHSESLPPVYKNKLTGYTKQTMTMDTCEKCHAQNGASNGCYVCHK
ncbi:MAG TPA: cytochrome C, partial [Desulfohalobiaceae bacterium]|nr:cytochrome C [Desulfohalobiaceae bacterium]